MMLRKQLSVVKAGCIQILNNLTCTQPRSLCVLLGMVGTIAEGQSRRRHYAQILCNDDQAFCPFLHFVHGCFNPYLLYRRV